MKLFKVLVVDDDDNLSFLIGEKLGNEGYESAAPKASQQDI